VDATDEDAHFLLALKMLENKNKTFVGLIALLDLFYKSSNLSLQKSDGHKTSINVAKSLPGRPASTYP